MAELPELPELSDLSLVDSRPGDTHHDGARSLLLTVLSEYVLPAGQPVWTSALVDALALLGVEEKAARQALTRDAAAGWLVSERVGRRVRWSLTPAARRLLNAGCARIASFGHNGGRWDGTWLVLLINVPEARREVRRTLRTRLAWAGFGSPEPGLWVCPNTAREADTRRILVELDLTAGARSFIARHGAIGAPESMAARAWNLAELDERYVRFVATFAAVTPADPTAVWTALTRLVHDWRRFPFADPDLPAALLPPNWTGTTAAALFHRRHAEWVQGAQARWTTLAAG